MSIDFSYFKMRLLFVFFLALIYSITCCAQEKKSVEDEIGDVMAKYQSVGVSAVVVKDNKICYQHTWGYNPNYDDTTLRAPIPVDGVYWLASVSKTFISSAIMQLVKKKRIGLDDDVNRYLKFPVRNPRFPDSPITVRMLLCHRSSLNDSQYGWTLKMMDPANKSYGECFNDYRPGEKYSYCNLNYSLLGAIIEGVTGKRFDEYIDNNICKPLGLEGSFNLTNIDSTKLVRTYSYDQKKMTFYADKSIYSYKYIQDKLADYELGKSTGHLSPAGGMRMSVMDLTKWMMVHMNYGKWEGKRILKKKSELTMWTPQGPDQKYGFAFSTYDKVVPGISLYGMTGGSHGIHSLFFFDPEKKYGFVVICNGCNSTWGNGGDMNYEIVRVLYNHFIKEQ